MDDSISYKKSVKSFKINKSKLPLNRYKTYAELKEGIDNSDKSETMTLLSYKQDGSFVYDGKTLKLKENIKVLDKKLYDLYRVFTFKSVKYQVMTIDNSEYVDGTMLPYPFVTNNGERSSNRELYPVDNEKFEGYSYLGRINESLLKELIECDFIFEVEKILDREGITKNEQKL